MVDFKKVKAPNNTITRNPAVLAAKADNNIYEAVAVIAKRSNQIAAVNCRNLLLIQRTWKRFLKIANR